MHDAGPTFPIDLVAFDRLMTGISRCQPGTARLEPFWARPTCAGAPRGDWPSQSAPKARASSEQKSAAKRSGAKRTKKGPSRGPSSVMPKNVKGFLHRTNVRRLRALLPLGGLELDLCAFDEGAEALAGDAGKVHEQILRPVVGGDEAIPLLVTEPLHGAGCQLIHLPRTYHRERRPRRLVYTSFGRAVRIPVLSNCSLCPRIAATRLTSACWSGRTRVLPRPERPARPVLPTRCT